MTQKILIIEDDAPQRILLAEFLRKKLGMECYKAENGRVGLAVLGKNYDKISLILTDIQMPVMDGFDVLDHVREHHSDIPIIVMTSSDDVGQAAEVIKRGAIDFITKPYDQDRLTVTIGNALKIRDMRDEIARRHDDDNNRYRFHHMIGHDSGLQDVVRLGRKAALVDLPALILGQTGTGKELFAKAIHGESNRSGQPFVTVNCGAIPSELVESTLFGHEKGAFTGATEATIGKFREADGGCLFLDEVGELPLAAQVKLLRVLQEGEVQPVGGSRAIKVNVRLIFATHRDLSVDVKQGRFREDLFYRLNVLQMTLPQLCDRKQDIPDLINHFVHLISIRSGMPMKSVHGDAMGLLGGYHWPGNVRELENVINRAYVFAEGEVLMPDDFDLGDIQTNDEKEFSKIQSKGVLENAFVFKTMQDIEKHAIRQTLDFHKGNVTKTAETLSIAKSTLYRKLRDYKFI